MAENKNVAGVKSPELVKYLDCGVNKKNRKQMQTTNIINNCVNNQQNNFVYGFNEEKQTQNLIGGSRFTFTSFVTVTGRV